MNMHIHQRVTDVRPWKNSAL